MKKFFLIPIIFILIIFLLPVFVFAQGDINAGFVSGLWYSKEPFFAGENIRIYGAIRNHSGYDIDGTLRFFDREQIIGEKKFSAINGELIQEWIDWKVTEGEHEISVKIIDAQRSEPGSGFVSVSLNPTTSDVSKVIADLDTDRDGVGNTKDSDDDNDGILDSVEIENGSDPLDPEDPGDIKAEGELEEDEAPEGFVDDVLEKAKDANEKINEATSPTLEKAKKFFEEKEENLLIKIEDEKKKELSDEEKVGGALSQFAEKLPPVFRLIYLWFLRLFIWIFSAWWKVLIVVLEVMFLLKKVYNKFF